MPSMIHGVAGSAAPAPAPPHGGVSCPEANRDTAEVGVSLFGASWHCAAAIDTSWLAKARRLVADQLAVSPRGL